MESAYWNTQGEEDEMVAMIFKLCLGVASPSPRNTPRSRRLDPAQIVSKSPARFSKPDRLGRIANGSIYSKVP